MQLLTGLGIGDRWLVLGALHGYLLILTYLLGPSSLSSGVLLAGVVAFSALFVDANCRRVQTQPFLDLFRRLPAHNEQFVRLLRAV